jgi:hypothetical protein
VREDCRCRSLGSRDYLSTVVNDANQLTHEYLPSFRQIFFYRVLYGHFGHHIDHSLGVGATIQGKHVVRNW